MRENIVTENVPMLFVFRQLIS